MNQNVTIEKPKLILAEGRDAELFLVWARNTYRDDQDLQIIDFGGITELSSFLLNLPNMENFDNVESLVIVRDAETDADAAAQSMRNAMTQADLPVPAKSFEFAQQGTLKTAFMLFPGPDDSDGRLEDLCLRTIEQAELMTCVNDYLACARDQGIKHNRPHKNKLHTYLSGTTEYVGLPIGLASREGAWNYEHNAMKPFKNIIQEM